MMHQNWETQNIVVTGAASGLGRAICTRFIQLGASVAGIVDTVDCSTSLRSRGKKETPCREATESMHHGLVDQAKTHFTAWQIVDSSWLIALKPLQSFF